MQSEPGNCGRSNDGFCWIEVRPIGSQHIAGPVCGRSSRTDLQGVLNGGRDVSWGAGGEKESQEREGE